VRQLKDERNFQTISGLYVCTVNKTDSSGEMDQGKDSGMYSCIVHHCVLDSSLAFRSQKNLLYHR